MSKPGCLDLENMLAHMWVKVSAQQSPRQKCITTYTVQLWSMECMCPSHVQAISMLLTVVANSTIAHSFLNDDLEDVLMSAHINNLHGLP